MASCSFQCSILSFRHRSARVETTRATITDKKLEDTFTEEFVCLAEACLLRSDDEEEEP